MPGADAFNNNTQSGGSITWTHNLTPSLSLNTEADYLRTVANPPAVGKTNQGIVRATFTTPIATNTTAYAGARYQQLRSDVSSNYNEYARLRRPDSRIPLTAHVRVFLQADG